MREIIPNGEKSNGYYRYFNGKWYFVKCIAEHTETGELMVIYQAMYGERKVYARPYEMFVSKVDKEKYPYAEQEYRFMSVDELKSAFGEERVSEMIHKELF